MKDVQFKPWRALTYAQQLKLVLMAPKHFSLEYLKRPGMMYQVDARGELTGVVADPYLVAEAQPKIKDPGKAYGDFSLN